MIDKLSVLAAQQTIRYFDAVEAHSCIDPLMPNSFLSKTQLLMINQLQDVSTRRSLSTVYRMLSVTFSLGGETLIITKYKVTVDTKTILGHRVTVWDMKVPRMLGKA